MKTHLLRISWWRILQLWICTNVFGTGAYLCWLFVDKYSSSRSLLQDKDLQFFAIMLTTIGAASSFPACLLSKFIFPHTLIISTVAKRIASTLGAVIGLFCLSIALLTFFISNPRSIVFFLNACLGFLVPAAPYLLGALISTGLLYHSHFIKYQSVHNAGNNDAR